jgi:hypothetical protein
MRILKKAIKQTLAVLGYELHRSSWQRESFDNFVNLAEAYFIVHALAKCKD